MLQKRINNGIQLREKVKNSDRQEAFNGEVKQYAQIHLKMRREGD